MSKYDELTPERLAALATLADNSILLIDLAQRAEERRARQGRATGEVRKHNWTEKDAQLNGLQNSMKSVLRAHAKSVLRMESAIMESDKTSADVLMIRDLLDKFHEELKLESESETA